VLLALGFHLLLFYFVWPKKLSNKISCMTKPWEWERREKTWFGFWGDTWQHIEESIACNQ
jgi:hypothetical protein